MKRGTTLLLAGLGWLLLFAGAQNAAAATSPGGVSSASNVNYHNGPVSQSMTGVLVSWSSGVSPVYTNETSGDPGLIKYLAANSGSTGDIGGVLAQYMDNSGHNAANAVSYGQQYTIAPTNTATTLSDSAIQTELVNQIQAGHVPRPTGNGLQTMYLLLFPSGDTECIDNAQTQCSGTTFCAYHSNTVLPDGTNVLYAVLPDNMSGPMTQGCGNARTLFGDQTSYLSHEWSETITDPTGTAWWNTSTGNEIGDNCNGQTTSNGPWTVQLEWSNIDQNCLPAEPAYNAPTASFIAPNGAQPGQRVSFDASSSSDPSGNGASAAFGSRRYSINAGIATYSWNWGDGTASAPSSTATATHTYAQTGNYNVSLTVTDNLGFTSTVTQQIAITASTPPPPVVSTDAASGVTANGATLGGTINPEGQAVQYQFDYGTSPTNLDQVTPLTTGPNGTNATPVSATLSGLSSGTTYYYQLNVFAGGQTYTGSVTSFTTSTSTSSSPPPPPPPSPSPAPAPPPQTPTIATGSASQITTGSALLAGTVDAGGSTRVTYHFAYGTSPSSLGSRTPETSGPSGTTALPVTAMIGGLNPATRYYFEVVASLNGRSYAGSLGSFTTLAPAPGATTGQATTIASSGATVLGTIYPNGVPTTYVVEFGSTTRYGHSTARISAGASASGVPITVALAGLNPRMRYHYRVVAISAGGTAVGADRTFTTAKAPGPAPVFRFKLGSGANVAAAQGGRLTVSFSCNKGCSAYFSVTAASQGLKRFTPVPVTLARGYGRLRSKGTATARIAFIPAIRGRLPRYRHVKLLLSGYAISAASNPSRPLSIALRLT